MTRGGQRKSNALERHALVFDRKTNAFRGGTAQLPPPPRGDDETRLPRKLRLALALTGTLDARRAAASASQPPNNAAAVAPKPPPSTAPPASRAARVSPEPARVDGRSADHADEGAAKKRKAKHEGTKARRKRLRRERAAADEAEHGPPPDAPRFGEVAQAPPAVSIKRKHGLGELLQRQLAGAARARAQDTRTAKDSRAQDQLREGAIAHYRKLRGRAALPYLAAMREQALM